MNQQKHNSIPSGTTISSLLHDQMVRTGATETEVAELLGTDQSQVGRWRRGSTIPRVSALKALSEYLGVDVHELELARVESEHVRADLAARKNAEPERERDLHCAEELKAAKARIKRLELKLAECLGADHNRIPAGRFVGDELDGQVTASAAVTRIRPRALTADDVGVAMALRGKSPGRSVRRMFREGQLPAPIDATLPAVSWRWSPDVISAYISPQQVAAAIPNSGPPTPKPKATQTPAPTVETPAPTGADGAETIEASLRRLKALHGEGILTDDEYETKRQRLADQL
jgi:transcriptional regulator with XRE-family HTH domain